MNTLLDTLWYFCYITVELIVLFIAITALVEIILMYIPQDKISKKYNTAAKSNRFGTQDKPNKNVIRTWATTQEKSIQRISRPK